MMVVPGRFAVAVVVLAVCGHMALCTPTPTEQHGPPPPPVEGTHDQAVDDHSSTDGQVEGVDAEGRSCGTCGITPHTPPVLTHDFTNFNLPFPDVFGKLHDKLQDVKLLTLIGLAIPILVLQIITLSIVAYLLKIEKKHEEDTGTGTGTAGYYAVYPTQTSGGYMDSYSSYRSLVPSEDTMSWVLEKLSSAVDLYHDYQDQHNTI